MSAPDLDWCGYLALAHRLAGSATATEQRIAEDTARARAAAEAAPATATLGDPLGAAAIAAVNADRRSALSRAYYSIYNQARLLVANIEPMYLSNSDDHKKMWHWFTTRPGKGRQIYTLGWGLRAKRNTADYDESARVRGPDVETAIKMAESVAKLVDEHAKMPAQRR